MIYKLKQKAFWIAIIFLLAGFVAIFAKVHLPLINNINDLKKKMKDLNNQVDLMLLGQVYSPQDINEWKILIEESVKDYENTKKFYEDIDIDLEKWIDEEDPLENIGKFVTKLYQKSEEASVKLKMMEKTSETLSTDSRKGLNWEWPQTRELFDLITGKPTQDEKAKIMKILQKRYWIRMRVLAALDGLNFTSLNEIEFLRSLDQTRYGTTFNYPGVSAYGKGGSGGAAIDEFILPGGLGTTISFGITVLVANTDIPKLVSKILSPDLSPRLLVELVGFETAPYTTPRVEGTDQNPFEVTVRVPPETPPAGVEQITKQEYEKLQPGWTQLRLTLRVIDFDTDKLAAKGKELQNIARQAQTR